MIASSSQSRFQLISKNLTPVILRKKVAGLLGVLFKQQKSEYEQDIFTMLSHGQTIKVIKYRFFLATAEYLNLKM